MNILVYVIDCLRSDHVSCYGYSRETTPNIDAVAADGIQYTQCFSPATWTRPVSVSLLTGSYPPTHGVRHRNNIFPSDLKRLPQYLSEAGFKTVGASTMGNVSSTLGYDVGFDTYYDIYKEEEIIQKRQRASTDREKLLHEDREEIALPRGEDINKYLEPEFECANDDLFAFAWSIDPHMPLDPPNAYKDFLDTNYEGPIDGSFETLPDEFTTSDLNRLQDLYDCEIQYTDSQFGKLVNKLKQIGEYEESLIIVMGDHGEAFYEHDHIFHGSVPHDEVLHVPLVIKPPKGTIQEPQRISNIVSLIDVLPTILEIMNIDVQEEHIQGKAIPPFNPNYDNERSVYSETHIRDFKPAYYSVRNTDWKYIETKRSSLIQTLKLMYNRRGELSNRKYVLKTIKDAVIDEVFNKEKKLLYNIKKDPGELYNVAKERPDITDELETQLVDWLDECARLNNQIRTVNEEIDSETMEQLQQLGYTD
ncbi:sulfatase-like hydrolase/transferase [Halegenticoccus tardaugens]|uniref:sulfatase-like hydrolase/transferase n=1 Tax=Halegenticoccus tardaugens TaxID=2071624 RepID=UPI00100B70A4|nr:sulfatase-like hydrolase/transferase [Halegenticoccus tardaugens]